MKRQGRLAEPPRTGVARFAPRPASSSLCRAQTQAVRSLPPRRSGASRYSRRAPLPGVIVKPFTARDVLSRWDVIQAHTRATAQSAAQLLDTL